MAYILSDADKPHRGRRLTWAQFTQETGRPKPDYRQVAANDNAPEREEKAA